MKMNLEMLKIGFAQGIDIYYLRKFQRSSYSTGFIIRLLLNVVMRVKAGDILTNGSCYLSMVS